MKVSKKVFGGFLLVSLVFGLLRGLPLYAQTKEAKEVLGKVAQRWKEIKDFQADLATGIQMMGSWMTMESKIWSKGDKFRMEMDLPSPQGTKNKMNMVFDGKTMWQYIPLQNMVIKIDFTSLMNWAKEKGLEKETMMLKPKQPLPLPPDVKYKVSEKEKEGRVYYLLETEEITSGMMDRPELKAMKNSQFMPKKIVFWIRKDDFFPFRYEVYSQEDSLGMWMEFRNVQTDIGIEDKNFIFQPPSDAQIMDMTDMMKKSLPESTQESGND